MITQKEKDKYQKLHEAMIDAMDKTEEEFYKATTKLLNYNKKLRKKYNLKMNQYYKELLSK